ncbi:MAG TPA: Ig-like domain-containing protein [Terracidiphilus sp.]|nr:Ig-like domain-containing protein [Terracidiphilus sp.]
MKALSPRILLLFLFAAPAFATVSVSSPQNGATLNSSVAYSATATTSTCSKGVASMGVYVDYKLLYVVNGTTLNATLSVGAGTHNTVVEEWDYCGGATFVSMTITVSGQSGVFVASPANQSTVSNPANFVATATSPCSKGVAAIGVYVNNSLVHVDNGAKLNTQLTLGAGAQHTVVEEWDYCGGASYTPIDITVQGSGKVLNNLQASGGWNSWGEFAPNYDICSSNCSGVNWSMWKHQASPSLSGNASRFNIGGSTPYSDVLWSNPVIGQFSTQGIPDSGHTLLPSLHYFTYDADLFVTNASVTQVLEFDINMYMNGAGMIWGTQCNNLGGKVWDIWDNANAHWVSSGVPCNLINNGWNHVTIQAQRQSNNTLLYQSITLNGVTSVINKTYAPFSVPTNWWGITLNYQMDGDHKMSSNVTYIDNLKFTYW